jgi:WD40 repeat protein
MMAALFANLPSLRIEDQKVLANIAIAGTEDVAKRNEPGNLACDAVSKMTDQALLARVAFEAPERSAVEIKNNQHSPVITGLGGQLDAQMNAVDTAVVRLPGGQVVQGGQGGTQRTVVSGFRANVDAVKKLTDRALLEKLKTESNVPAVRTAAEFRIVALRRAHDGLAGGLLVSSNGKILASASNDKTIKLWSLPEGKLLTTLEGYQENTEALAITPDGKLLALAGAIGSIRLLSLPDGKLLKT